MLRCSTYHAICFWMYKLKSPLSFKYLFSTLLFTALSFSPLYAFGFTYEERKAGIECLEMIRKTYHDADLNSPDEELKLRAHKNYEAFNAAIDAIRNINSKFLNMSSQA